MNVLLIVGFEFDTSSALKSVLEFYNLYATFAWALTNSYSYIHRSSLLSHDLFQEYEQKMKEKGEQPIMFR